MGTSIYKYQLFNTYREKMQLYLTLMLILSVAVVGLCHAVPGAITKKPCCPQPPQWQGYISQETETEATVPGHPAPVYGMMAVDVPNKRMAMSFSSEVWGYKYNVTSIADYDKHVLYIINWEQNTCGKSELEGEMTDHCIPEDAQFLGSMRYGLGDKNRIDADVWKFTKKQQFPMPQTLTMTMEVTAD